MITGFLRLSLVCALAVPAVSCSSATGSSPAASHVMTPDSVIALPEPPASVATPGQAATYQLSHFWDGMDFADTTLTRNSKFMEANVERFLSLYPEADADSLPAITARFLSRATADAPSRYLLYDVLTEASQPDVAAIWLREWLQLPVDPYELEEPRYRLNAYLKNRPGTQAADFAYTTVSGLKSTLLATAAPRLLMLFYDPDCDHCVATIGRLRHEPAISAAIAADKLKVLAVYTEGDDALWRSTAGEMPADWIVATDGGKILADELYDIPEMPGIYLLDASKTVILRDPSVETLLNRL